MNFTILLLVSIFSSFTVTANPGCLQLLNTITEVKQKLDGMENRLLTAENQIKIGKLRVAFSVGVDPGADLPTGPFPTDTTLIYNIVQTNIANGYDPRTGIFTAPVAGVYYFSIFFHTDSHLGAQLQLFKNSHHVLTTKDGPTLYEADRADNGGNAVSLQLQQGDQVYVRMTANTRVWGHTHLTTFNGFLIVEI